ncbi:MAG: hypothetical protein V1703_01990 [Candidatus Altiarchaeota archaeon]
MAPEERTVDSQKHPQQFFRTDADPFKQLPVIEIRARDDVGHNLSPIRILLDENEGLPIGLKIVRERPTFGVSAPLSKYISVSGTAICDLDVENIYRMTDRREVDFVLEGSGHLAITLFKGGDFSGAMDVMEGIVIPSSERGWELSGRPYVPFAEAARGIRHSVEKRGMDVPKEIGRVLDQPLLDSAIREIDKLQFEPLIDLMMMCSLRMGDSVQGAEVMRMTTHAMRRMGELMWTATGGRQGIKPREN